MGTKFCPRCGHPINNSNNNSTTTNTHTHQNQTRTTSQPQQPIQPINKNNVKATAQNKMNSLLNMKQDTEREEAENNRKEESLSLQERTYIDNKVANNSPSTGVTYLLGIFLFGFGVSQWYLHHYVAGTLILINSFVLSWLFGLGLFINGIWWLADLFLYPLIHYTLNMIKQKELQIFVAPFFLKILKI